METGQLKLKIYAKEILKAIELTGGGENRQESRGDGRGVLLLVG